MPAHPVLHTQRLCLRPWRDEDVDGFAALSDDPRVMEFFPRLLDRAECEAVAVRVREHFDRHGFGYWAVELPGKASFIGFVGLGVPQYETPFTPCVEIGWRLAYDYWGKGYATEGAQAALRFGFGQLKLDEIVSFAVVANWRSRHVMERLGMRYSPGDDFDHPRIPEGHVLRRHVLYRLSRGEWEGRCPR